MNIKILIYNNTIMSKILVLYVFHEYNQRVKLFFERCIFKDDNIDFMVISNNLENTEILNLPSYVKTMRRNNIGYDFGGWSDALLTNELYTNYENFVFVNSSVVGPFTTSYFTDNWVNIYVNGLKGNIKLFGSTINAICDPLHKPLHQFPMNKETFQYSHIQSYIFAMNKETLLYLIECEIFSITKYAETFKDAVWDKEVLMSRKVIDNGWNIGSLMSYYQDVDFTFTTKTPEQYNIRFLGDIMNRGYRNKVWNEFEVIFVKGNRISFTV